ncbi:low-density lipoprotein receptor-related protein 2 [Corchorus capsularis]|uniref:Low-density lipoprotein receptor-related protein 2 n=1 Tax=Corchorus capsularis TaxID=210143 RepID=A0A1R3J6S0_COCAP|nr:low-density lipoprotein receptor-related protein 2 [Corchorus capsularis]
MYMKTHSSEQVQSIKTYKESHWKVLKFRWTIFRRQTSPSHSPDQAIYLITSKEFKKASVAPPPSAKSKKKNPRREKIKTMQLGADVDP